MSAKSGLKNPWTTTDPANNSGIGLLLLQVVNKSPPKPFMTNCFHHIWVILFYLQVFFFPDPPCMFFTFTKCTIVSQKHHPKPRWTGPMFPTRLTGGWMGPLDFPHWIWRKIAGDEGPKIWWSSYLCKHISCAVLNMHNPIRCVFSPSKFCFLQNL